MFCFPHIYIQWIFLLFVGEPFFSRAPLFSITSLMSHLIALWNVECLLCCGTWVLNETSRNYVKVSSLLDLWVSDIWKWDHCHVASLSKGSNWWIFHPCCLLKLSRLHTDVHCIKHFSGLCEFLYGGFGLFLTASRPWSWALKCLLK